MAVPKQEIRSTFPIKAAEIARRKWRTALTSPLTWAPFLPAVGSYAFLDVHGGVVSGIVAAIAAGLFYYWNRKGPEIERQLVEDLIKESNQEQDQALSALARDFQRRGFGAYAVNFGRFIELKQQLEATIHDERKDPVSAAERQVEKLVDSLCFGVGDEFERLIKMDTILHRPNSPLSPKRKESFLEERREAAQRINRAYQTLTDTHLNLDSILHPVVGSVPGGNGLDNIIDKLEEEAEIARRVKERLEADSAAAASITPESIGESDSSTSTGDRPMETQ